MTPRHGRIRIGTNWPLVSVTGGVMDQKRAGLEMKLIVGVPFGA
jgi:hypothetical protein